MEATKACENSTLKNVVVDNIQQSVDELGKLMMALGDTAKREARSRSRSTRSARSSDDDDDRFRPWRPIQLLADVDVGLMSKSPAEKSVVHTPKIWSMLVS